MGKGAKIQNVYPLTAMQQGMLFNYLYNKDSKAYFQQLSFSLEADLDIDAFEKSLNKVIERYDVFRSIFIYEKVEEPKQVVLAERKARIYYEDISQMKFEERVLFLDEFKEKDKEKGFDISKDLLMRVSIIRLGVNDYQVVWSHHHIIMDGWCLGVVLKDFISIYRTIKYGDELKLAKGYQYVDYINWLVKQDKNYAEQYWKSYLEDYDNDISLQQKVKTKIYEYAKKEIHFTINKELTSKVVDVCRKNNVTLNNVFQAIWAILLQKYNNVDDVVFGAVVSGRNAPIDGIEKMVGLFINTIPIRVKCDGNLSFKNLLEKVRDNYNKSIKYDFMSLAQIQNTCNLKQSLISNLFIFENYPARDIMNKGDNYKIKDVQSFEQTNYDFNIVIIPSDEIYIKLKYNSLVYDDKVVETIKNHILEIINCICSNSEICLKDIRMLTDNEYKQLVYKFNLNEMEYPINATIHELFEEQVVKTPDNAAVVYKNDAITYKELNEKANSVARVLRDMGVKRDTIVALVTERSIEMIIGILAVLKAGGAYLPIDSQYPNERVNYMLNDSKAKMLITNTDIKDISFNGNIVDLRDNAIFDKDKSNLENINLAKDLAYIIYTSGTTGKPKGVMIENRSVINLSINLYKKIYQKYKSKLNVALLSPYVFDASVKQIFPCVLFGQTLVIIPEEERLNGEKLVNYYVEHSIDISDGTPAHLSIIQDILLDKDIEFPTKQFVIGGEELSIDLVRKIFNIYQNKSLKITNVYGPTECCDVSTMYDIDNQELEKLSIIPIGKNLENVQIYILDKQLNPVPFGTPGEIYISGDGLSRGYLNHLELTEDRFINNPFIDGAKMYRTGDLGKRASNGDIEYLGRIDHQVKIRGFRIELGEIEKQILSYTGIKETVVICGENNHGSKYIAAFLISNGNLNVNELRKYLSKSLPNYMIPTYIMEVDKFPVTHNGKINKNELIEKIRTEQVQYVSPRNRLEEIVASVWKEVLHVDKVGICDDFFALGGDDNSVLRAAMELQKHNIVLNVSDLRLYPTIEKLGKHIKHIKSNACQQTVTGDVELTPIQKDFFERKLSNKDRWNQAFSLFKKDGFDEVIVKNVFGKIIEHHDALRMRYTIMDDRVIQHNDGIEEDLFTLDIYNLRNSNNVYESIEEAANKLHGEIRLDKGPLVKLGLFRTIEGDHLLIIIHHLVIDGVSWRIILEDFATGYKQLLNNQSISFPEKTDSFKHWAKQLKEYSNTEKALQEINYWKSVNKASVNVLKKDNLVTDRKFKDVRIKELIIAKEETTNLLKNVHRAYGTQTNEILLSILGLALKEWNGFERVLINLEGHGREEIIENVNIKRTVGWFTSFYPVDLDMNEAKPLEKYISGIKDSLRKVPNKGIGYGVLKYMSELEYEDKISFQFKPEINFNYLGQFGEEVSTDIFTLSDAPIGNCVDIEDKTQYALNIICKVIDKQLAVSFRYDCTEFNDSNITKLKEIFYEKLKEVIVHCIDVSSKMMDKQNNYFAPRNNIEKELIKIWESVLGVSRIGIYDDFFELGGDSIKAIKILSKANNLKIPVSVKAILEYRTVERIMDNCYMNNDMDVNSEIAVSLQHDSCDLEKERTYNKSFKVTTDYPKYYGCMTGVILEKLKHEKNIYLERSFLAIGGGKFFFTYGHVNDRGLENRLQYRELPTEMIPGVSNIFDKLGVKEEVKSFKDLETGLTYCKEHLSKNELVMISGTTYYLNYTPDYCIGEEEWKRRLDVRPENIIAVSNKSSGRAHTFLLVDIIKDGYLVYDTTFKYFGVISKDDFNKSFAGLKGMSFLDGMYAQTTNLPYAVTELDLSLLKEVNNGQLALEILKNNIDINLSNQRIDFKANGYEFTFYTGVRVYKEIAGMLKEFQNKKTHIDDIKKLIQSSFGSWQYKFMFFQEFLDDLSKYIEIPKNYKDYCNSFINDCTIINSKIGEINSTNIDNFIIYICSNLENIYEQQVSLLNNLKRLIP
ncbi:MAG: amino acid adenylation domain-containing protein [Bacillota bacterium]|nr:amino acid adenylation domain-containing protein [Bacillota bacterium]